MIGRYCELIHSRRKSAQDFDCLECYGIKEKHFVPHLVDRDQASRPVGKFGSFGFSIGPRIEVLLKPAVAQASQRPPSDRQPRLKKSDRPPGYYGRLFLRPHVRAGRSSRGLDGVGAPVEANRSPHLRSNRGRNVPYANQRIEFDSTFRGRRLSGGTT
jgi:hypothetical protein